MNKTESYCYQKYKSSSNNSCVIKEENIVGKNLLEGTYFDGNGIPKMIGITKAEYLEYKQLQQENKILKDNWDELKKIIRKKQDYYRRFKDNRYRKFLSELLDIIQEIEQGSDSNDSN